MHIYYDERYVFASVENKMPLGKVPGNMPLGNIKGTEGFMLNYNHLPGTEVERLTKQGGEERENFGCQFHHFHMELDCL